MLMHQGSAILHGERIKLRPYRQGDAEAMYKNWCSDPEVCRYLSWAPRQSLEENQSVLDGWLPAYRAPHCYRWGITLDGQLIGDLTVVRWNEKLEEAELGYCLGRAWWGRGLMTEAVLLARRYLFDVVGFRRLCIRHVKENAASGRVIQKAGLLYEGCLKGTERLHDGSFADVCVYGLINERWQEKGATS